MSDVSDRCGAIIQGSGAVAYMALRIAEMTAALASLPLVPPVRQGYAENIDKVSRAALLHMEACMNVLGDYLSNVDAVLEIDETATDAAFARVQELNRPVASATH